MKKGVRMSMNPFFVFLFLLFVENCVQKFIFDCCTFKENMRGTYRKTIPRIQKHI